ncbi:Peroxiredoxin [Paracoccus halophilus]|uniref:Peroxiredoxin n=1 Tax=Paracoccus halophilus TaxID=376733 RepID=A0A099F7I1_9RHOB|nr:TlpA disulfide reductase family protein [Paracoccus halophilus]KGJ06655.1 hypothetical protein IT41_00270 [Paracoccus halophilus]SFA42405.1 Peroxiredoxin [Paracoccus halophilus]
MTRILHLIALIGLLALAACKDEAAIEVGQPVPDLAVLDRDGNPVDLAAYRGKVVFVNFWQSGCGPCLVEMPEIEQVYQDLRSRGFEVLAINMGQDGDTIENTRRRTGVSYPLLADRLKLASVQFGVLAVPTSFLIDRDGRLVERINGPLTRAQLETRLAQLL